MCKLLFFHTLRGWRLTVIEYQLYTVDFLLALNSYHTPTRIKASIYWVLTLCQVLLEGLYTYLHKVPSQGGTLEAESSLCLPSPEMGPRQLRRRSASLSNSSAQRNIFSTYAQRQVLTDAGWRLTAFPYGRSRCHSLAAMSQLVSGRAG